MTSPDHHPADRPASSAPPELIHLRGPGDVVATIPYHLGYQPTDSLVLIGLHGEEGRRFGFVARVDLPTSPEEVWPTADLVVPRVLAQGPHRVLLVAYEDDPSGQRPSEPLARAVRDLVRDAGVALAERLVVRGGRFWSPDCDGSCCPAEGLPVPHPSEVPAVADYVLLGRSPARHRDDLVTAVAPAAAEGADDPARCAAVVALGRAFQGRGTGGAGPVPGPRLVGRSRRERELQEWGLAAWHHLLSDGTGTGGPVDPSGLDDGDRWSPLSPAPPPPPSWGLAAPTDVGVLLTASLRDVTLRDLVVTWMCPGSLDLDLLDPALVARAREVLPVTHPTEGGVAQRVAALCRSSPTGTGAAPLTVFANLVWWQGDGALARTALDLALGQEPDYRLALLLERMIDLAIAPRRRSA